MSTIFIAQVLGIFFVIAGVSMIVNRRGTAEAIRASVENRGILWLWGFLAVLVGATVVMQNNVWTSGFPLLVTILGWLAVVKGAFILILPASAVTLYRKVNGSAMLVISGIVAVILGLVLLYW